MDRNLSPADSVWLLHLPVFFVAFPSNASTLALQSLGIFIIDPLKATNASNVSLLLSWSSITCHLVGRGN